MTLSVASASECASLAAAALALDHAGSDLFSDEGLATSLRRAASVLCPASPRQLVDSVLDALRPLRPGETPDRDALSELVELLISAGDLIELPSDQRRGRLLYLGPPSFIEKRPGHYLVVGVRPFGTPLLDAELSAAIRYERHVRTIELDPTCAASRLRSCGLHQIGTKQWVAGPGHQTPEEVVGEARRRLDVARPSGVVAGLTILDPATSQRFYRGRWTTPQSEHGGDFVARRPQEYGADLWCLVRMNAGTPARLVDFPTADPAAPGRDEAWRLQAAIDAANGRPHAYRLRPNLDVAESTFVDFFAPLPTYGERYLELIGRTTSAVSGALFSYVVPNVALGNLADFLAAALWMRAARPGDKL